MSDLIDPDPISSLALLAEIERRYDGPYQPEAALSPGEFLSRRLDEATHAARFHAGRARQALRFARLHRSQGRPDLVHLMLDDLAAERARARLWRRRARLLQTRVSPGAGCG